MEKKAQVPVTQPVATEGKKDKNANPLLKNGVTNKDVRKLNSKLTYNIDLPNSPLPLQDRR